MSDPAKTPAEIEDVLASIRRLVSDHDTGMTEAAQAVAERPSNADMAVPTEDDGEPAERLVLTPSQRISDADDPWAPVVETEQDAAPEEAGESHLLEAVSHAVEESEASEIAAEIADESEWKPDDRLMDYAALGTDDAPTDDVPASDETGDGDDSVEETAVGTPEDDVASAEDVADLALLDGMAPTVANYESETGDDNWPSESAESALLKLVALRDPIRAVANAPSESEADAATEVAEQVGDAESDVTDEPVAGAEPEVADGETSDAASEKPAPEAEMAMSDAGMDAPEVEMPVPDAETEATGSEDEIEPSVPDAPQSDTFEDEPQNADVTDLETPDTEAPDMDASETDVAEAEDAARAEMAGAEFAPEHDPEPESASRKAEDDLLQKALAEASNTPEAGSDADMPIAPVFSRQRKRAAQHAQADDAVAAEPTPEMASAAAEETTADTTTATIFDADDGVLDEETLRDIIVDVVREELQGVLGQRITRNVRKMVRREIRLALAAEDLE